MFMLKLYLIKIMIITPLKTVSSGRQKQKNGHR